MDNVNVKGKLYFTSGLSRSGKSFFAKKWANYEDKFEGNRLGFDCWKLPKNMKRVVISGDAFRKALHGSDFRIEAESTVYATMDITTRALLNEGYDVLIDETCTTEQTLLRYLRLDINAQPIFFDVTEEECIQRAKDTNKPYLIGPIQRMAKQLRILRANWDETVNRLKTYLKEREQHDVAV